MRPPEEGGAIGRHGLYKLRSCDVTRLNAMAAPSLWAALYLRGTSAPDGGGWHDSIIYKEAMRRDLSARSGVNLPIAEVGRIR